MPTSRPLFLYISTIQKALFFERLSLYLHAGIPIAEALSFLSKDVHSPSLFYIAKALEENLLKGFPLSQGMMLFPRQFDAFSIGFIRAGESSGGLTETLVRLSVFLKKRASLKQKVLGSLAYPALIFFGAVMITVFLTFFIFPKILPIVQGLKTQLPFSTKLLLKITTVVTRQWRFLLFFSLVGVSGCIWITKIKQVRFFLEKILLRLPPFSLLYKKYAISIFSRTLAVQLERGIRIVTALDLTRTTVPGVLYKKSLNDICEKIKLGQRFSAALISEKTLFPPIVSQMIAAGETTGTLSKNLQTLADMYESDLDTLTKNLTVLIEPVLMICMGCVVGFIALAIITPIYAVTQNLNTN